jgi:hypothetical protein
MPPQQPDRLLDLGDDGFDFRVHIRCEISGVGCQLSTTEPVIPKP